MGIISQGPIRLPGIGVTYGYLNLLIRAAGGRSIKNLFRENGSGHYHIMRITIETSVDYTEFNIDFAIILDSHQL